MKPDFLPHPVPEDGAEHHYCLCCHSDGVVWHTEGRRRYCHCPACGRRADRALVIDPETAWWIADDGEYWHETAGVFVRDARQRFLFFDRTAFPFGWTIPAGHVGPGEDPGRAAARELEEETGIRAGDLRHIAVRPVEGDGCRRGADCHVWHVHLLVVDTDEDIPVSLGPEGTSAVWSTLQDAAAYPLTDAVRRLLTEYGDELTSP